MSIYQYFKIPIPEVSGYRWFKTLVIATVSLSILYLSFHLPPLVEKITSGNQKIDYLTTDEITVINQLLDTQPDSGIQTNNEKRTEVKDFIISRYPALSTAAVLELEHLILNTTSAALKSILPKTAIRQTSFFWLYGDYVFLEIIFGACLGSLQIFYTATRNTYVSKYFESKKFMSK